MDVIMSELINSRTEQALRTKESILNTAFKLIESEGYDNVTVESICNELNLSRGAFYHYFKSKSDIIFYRYKRTEGDYMDYYNRLINLPADKQLRAMFDWYNDYFVASRLMESKVILKIELENPYQYKNFATTNTFQVNIIANILCHGVDQGIFRKNLPAFKTSKYIFTYIYGIIYEWCISDGRFEFKDRLEDFYENFLLDNIRINKTL